MVLRTGGARLILSGPATSSNREGCAGWGSQTSSTAARPCTASGLCTTLAAAMPQHAHQQGHAVFTSPSLNTSTWRALAKAPCLSPRLQHQTRPALASLSSHSASMKVLSQSNQT